VTFFGFGLGLLVLALLHWQLALEAARWRICLVLMIVLVHCAWRREHVCWPECVTVTVTEALVLRPTRRLRAHHKVNPYPGARRQNETEMFWDHDETSPSIAAVSAPSVACFTLAVLQQKWLCRQFIDVSATRRGCHTMKHVV